MDVKTTTHREEFETREVVAWRRRQLREAGFLPEVASSLAGDCRLDLHALIELVERGCAPELAVRILAPLEDETRPC
jgi:hypothetical protein